MRSALSFAVTTALAAALARVPGDSRPYLDGPGGTPSGRVHIITPHAQRRDAASSDASRPTPRPHAQSRRGHVGERIIVPSPDAEANADSPAVQDPAAPGVGGSGQPAQPDASDGDDRLQQLEEQVAQLRQQLARQQEAGGGGAVDEQLQRLQGRAQAIELSREQRAALHAQVASLLGEAQLRLIGGDGDVGDILDAAEARLYDAGSQAVALGPADEVVRARGAVRAIDEARYWIENSDLWHARGSLDAAIFEAQAARKIANDYALPLVAPDP